jgi:hypothetical protein
MLKRDENLFNMKFNQFKIMINQNKQEMKISEFLKTQIGSKIYRRKLKKMKTEEKESLIRLSEVNFSDLLTNSYGNYFSQKLYSSCNTYLRSIILEKVKIF